MLLNVFGAVLLLIGTSQSANFFVSTPFGGSHLHSMWEIAVVLADAGHNITFINLEEGALKSYHHPNITGYTIKNENYHEIPEDMANKCIVEHLIKGDSATQMKTVFQTKACVDIWRTAYINSAVVYGGDEIKMILDSTNFDVIIAERTDYKNLAVVAKSRGIPVVASAPSLHPNSLQNTNFPTLFASQPSFVFNNKFSQPPSFTRRFSGIFDLFQAAEFMKISDDALEIILPKFGLTSFEEAKSTIKFFLTNDHPAFTFPFLLPPNDLAIGAMSLIDSKVSPLPTSVVNFIEDADNNGLPVIYISFGTYVDADSISWVNILLSALAKIDVKVIIKMKKGSTVSLGDKFLPLSWIPQKDLLRSRKVHFFISHCGNNGRIETIFFNVPVLCIPLFADQAMNSELVKWKGFGSILFKENIQSEQDVIEAVDGMLENHDIYQRNMKRASDIVQNEPGNVKEKFLFYMDLLAKYKNVDFLVNDIIEQQSLYEIYNLDIVLILLSGLLFATFVILLTLYTITCYACRKLLKSQKQKEQ